MASGSSCTAFSEDQVIFGGPQATASGSGLAFSRQYPTTTEWKNLAYEFDIWIFATSELANAATKSTHSQLFSLQFANHFPAPKLAFAGSCSTSFQSAKGAEIKYVYKYHVRDVMQIVYPANPLTLKIQPSLASESVVDSIGLRSLKIYNMRSSLGSAISANFPCLDSYFWDGASCQACHSTCSSCSGPNQGECTVCKTTAYDYGNGICLAVACSGAYQLIPGTKDCTKKCSSGFYWERSLSCIETCEEPLVQSVDPEGGASICSSPCSDATQFVYPDGSCVNTCPTPLSQKTENGIQLCENSCSDATKYINPDGSCSPTCDPPLIGKTEHGIFSCNSPCEDSTEYLHPDGSCLDKCPTLFSQKIEKNIKYCESPCSDATQFVYSDKSCSSQCPYPLSSKTESGAKYCFSPCDDFLYKNGSCLQSCNAPYIKSRSYDVDQCLSPCEDPQKEYFYEAEQVCKSTCTSSKTVDGVKVCSPTSQMTEKEVEETKNLVSSIKSQGKVTEAGMKTASVLSSGSQGFAWLAGQASMLYYIRYINLNYTPKLKLMFFLQEDASPFDFTIGINMPEGLKEKLQDQELPEIFERFGIHSNFFYNSWDMLSSFVLILGIILVFSVFKMLTAKYTKVDKVLAGVLGSFILSCGKVLLLW